MTTNTVAPTLKTFGTPSAGVELTYDIEQARLHGVVDGIVFDTKAGSGGRAGSTTLGALDRWLTNNPFATRVKHTSGKPQLGGPIPFGVYRLRSDSKKREGYIKLVEEDPQQMGDRDGMLIHERGPIGSQGCIVLSGDTTN